MRIRSLIYYISTGFVFGIIMLVTVQYITSTNLRELISGNESVLKEYKLANELVILQKDLLLLDNKIKTAIITGDSSKVKDFEFVVKKIKEDLRLLQQSSDPNISLTDVNKLQGLVEQKIDFSHQLADSFYKAGKPATDSLLTNKITALTHKIDTSGRAMLAKKIKTVDQSVQAVLNWHLYISILVLVLLTSVFLIVVHRMKNQAELIRLLNTSEKKLKEAALIKENFLANMSHEIRTPLNAILGYTHLLEKEKLDQTARLHLTTVQQSGQTLLSIVNDILDLSKIESGLMRIERVPFSLSELIHSVTTMFHHKVQEKGLTFNFFLSTTIPDTLMGDATRLTQILVNLIGNAVKFTQRGEINLSIREKKVDLDHVEIEFTISDTGIGIAHEKIDTIFERFRQAEDSTTRKFGGTGLGLSIVRDLIYLQNGSIELKSKPDDGTAVSFSISYGVARHLHDLVHFETTKPEAAIDKNQKVLIVEDNLINQGLMVQLLKGWDIANNVANNGKEAIEILQKEHFDLIFMDIQMPEMDGYTATIQIRQKLKLDVPIVAMTAHAMAGERDKCINFGMNEHISKPLRENELKKILFMFLKNSPSDKPDFKTINEVENQFKVIDLQYMKEVSGGDSGYEQLVTEQFLRLIPDQVAMLSTTFNTHNYPALKRTAHNLKTSISIMGLDTLLQDDLDALENENLDETQIQQKIANITGICNDALSEAKLFYSHF